MIAENAYQRIFDQMNNEINRLWQRSIFLGTFLVLIFVGNEALGEIDELTNVLGTIKDMQLELSEDPTKLSLDDITEEDPDAERKQSAEEFLEGE